MRYNDAMADRTWTELEVVCERMGWDPETVTIEDAMAVGGRRNAMTPERWEQLVNSPQIWKQCGICGEKICVNNWEDKKARTPRLAGFVICVKCDPRHADDRYVKEGYRILHPRRYRILRLAQVARAVKDMECLRNGMVANCKCPSCVARKVLV